MSEIDPEKLEEAITRMAIYFGQAIGHSDLLVIDAARAHLATLPKTKEVEVVSWATFTHDGELWSSGLTEKSARAEAHENPKLVPVRLVGIAKVRA